MNNNRKKERAIFLIVLAVTAIVFVGGVEYSKGAGNQSSPEILKNVFVAPTTSPAIAIATSSKAISTPPTVVIKKATITASTTTPILPAVIAPTPITAPPVPTPVPTPTPTPTPAPAPTPVPTPVVVATATTSTAVILPYSTNTFSTGDGWKTLWGNFTEANNSLTAGASDDSGGGGGVFAGTSLGTNSWSNYNFQATFDWLNGGTMELIAWYTDNNNYVACNFNEDYLGDVQMTLQQHENGIVNTLAQGDVTDYDQWGGTNLTASIQVDYSQGSCTFNNHTINMVGSGNALTPPYSGGIGFATWNSNSNNAANNSQVVVKSIEVDRLN